MGDLNNNRAFEIMFKHLYPHFPNDQFIAMTGLTVSQCNYHSGRLGAKKTRYTKAYSSRTDWTPERVEFLKANFFKLTNQQLANAINVRLTVLRNKTAELGLKRNEVENWKPGAIAFLIDNYRTIGDVEIMENLRQLWPRKMGWNRGHVLKKRTLLGLFRTPQEKMAIIKKHVIPGGRSFTILKNSSSLNMPDTYIASLIAWRDKDLQKEVLKHPEIIELKRSEIKLSRAIKEISNATH